MPKDHVKLTGSQRKALKEGKEYNWKGAAGVSKQLKDDEKKKVDANKTSKEHTTDWKWKSAEDSTDWKWKSGEDSTDWRWTHQPSSSWESHKPKEELAVEPISNDTAIAKKLAADRLMMMSEQRYEGKVIKFTCRLLDKYAHFTGYVDEDAGKVPLDPLGGLGIVLHTKGDCWFVSKVDEFKPGDIITFNICDDKKAMAKEGTMKPFGVNPCLKV